MHRQNGWISGQFAKRRRFDWNAVCKREQIRNEKREERQRGKKKESE
jgi:hypothetical protein